MRTFTGLLVVVAMCLVAFPSAAAQEATPTDGRAAAASHLAEFGLPELRLTTDGTSLNAPSELAAGRYRLIVENSNDARVAEVMLITLPDGLSADDAMSALSEASAIEAPGEPLPDAFFTMTFFGGAFAYPGASAEAIVTLDPGDYLIWDDAYGVPDEAATPISPTNLFATLVVTGTMPELTDPGADVTVTMMEMQFDMPDTVAAGPHVWRIDNKGAFPHFMDFNSYPESVTRDQVQATLNAVFEIPATPSAEPLPLLNVDELVSVAFAEPLSPGHSSWLVLDLERGTYVAFCWITGPGAVPTHATMGMFKVFTVA
jgi:hypothetical protein